MRVLQLGNYGADGGGISSVLHEYASWTWSEAELAFVDTYATAPRFFGAKRMLIAARTLISQRRQIDVAHIHLSQRGSFVREGLLVMLASVLRIRTVVTIHGSSFVSFATKNSALVKTVLKRVDQIAALTSQTEEALRARGFTNVTQIPNGVAPVQTSAAPLPISDRTSVLFAGEVSKRKGVDVLLAAWPLVLQSVPTAHLDIYGPAADAVVPSTSSITVHGRRDRSEVREALSSARVLTLPSRAEAFPMSILEAMSAGVPVVATDVGQVRGMLDDERQMSKLRDADDLARALISILSNDALAAELSARNARRFENNFSPTVVAARYEALYRASN